ncbi:hypothetical protein H632_c2204p0 [Helicosporidium sp. ATCC 50920]|nr:hypothetical protein H632_c2204p0 [Helicosporidium sp. ATCC 50920]|eukprot:KDD73410.1 hypothetical protein H632_c2204p0 [Helicosporidium sp. ATCC 50920]
MQKVESAPAEAARLDKMPGGQGYRCGTRYKFARAFRSKGYIPLSVYLRTYKVGDYVDIKVNGAVHKVRRELELEGGMDI